ncbi:MAG: GDSL-type esterase/lipase family protein [Victivallales bacterium]
MSRTILFQGDFITDCGRARIEITDRYRCRSGLGLGYPYLIAARLLCDRGGDLNFYNFGISGNRVVDLYARWKAHCINLRPDILSILIGVNDTWHVESQTEWRGSTAL